MNKILLLIFVFVFISTDFSSAQSSDDKERCMFGKPWIAHNDFLETYLQNIGYDTITQPLYAIPCVVRVYKGKDEKSPSDSDIKRMFTDLNALFTSNKTLLSFYIADIRYYNKNKFSKFGFYTDFPIQSLWRHDRKLLNYCIVYNLTKPGKANKNLLYTGACNSLNNTVVAVSRANYTVIAHETAHAFGLHHTHRYYKRSSRKQESVSRTKIRHGLFKSGLNCEINGDGLSDTEAQPYLGTNVTSKCVLKKDFNLTDNYGDLYRPQLDNLMSYPSNKSCRTKFTRQQIAVMLWTADQKPDSYKHKLIEGSQMQCDFDSYEPDNSFECADLIQDDSLRYHTFHAVCNKRGKYIFNDVDFVKIVIDTLAANHKILSVSNRNTASAANIAVEIFDEFHNHVADFEKPINQNLDIDLSTFRQGSYFIKLYEKNPCDSNFAREFTLSYSSN